ncbi:MAG TPA: phytoene desaturase family protein [Allocoleopsis sp.]
MAKLSKNTRKNSSNKIVSKKIVIIGSGFGGLSAAALLSKQGHDVLLLEKNESHGGRARVWKSKGFTFDMGPSWYLMPDVFEKFFKELGTTPEKEFKLKLLSPSYRIFFGKDSVKDKKGNIIIKNKIVDVDSGKKGYELFNALETDGKLKLEKYLKQSEYQYNIAMDGFIYKEYNSIFDMINYKTMIEGSKLKVFDNMDKFTRRFFDSDEARKILEYNLVFLGGDPKNTPALYSIMAHIDFNMGVWYPMGGLGKVTTSIMNIAKKNGAKFLFNSPVDKIVVESGKVKGVTSRGKTYEADIVISNADYEFTETNLLDEKYISYNQKFWDKKIVAPSAFIIYLGLNKKIKNLKHHNLFLENDWMNHFREIFENPKWPDSPSYYICCPSKSDSSVAPKNCENIFILVPVASGLQDTESIRKKYYDKTMSHINSLLGEDLTKHIVVKRIFSLNDFKNDYNAFKGTALGISHTLMQTGYFRPHQRSKKVKNLFYVGQYTHPGIGMPMAIISAQIVNDIIKKEFK